MALNEKLWIWNSNSIGFLLVEANNIEYGNIEDHNIEFDVK